MVPISRNVVVKVEVNTEDGTELHRFVLGAGTNVSFNILSEKIFSRLDDAKRSSFRLFYKDNEGEQIRLTDDGDLEDALLIQKLNPLRISLMPLKPTSVQQENAAGRAPLPSRPVSQNVEATGVNSHVIGVAPAMIEEIFKHVNKAVKKSEDRATDVANILDAVSTMLVNTVGGAVGSGTSPLNKSNHSATAGSKFHVPSETTANTQQSGPRKAEEQVESDPVLELKKSETGKEPQPNEVGDDESLARAFHSRVQCDGCGMLPIVGPRFKSTVKDDYDLCLSCHSKADDKQDYNRIDRPLFKPRHALWGPRNLRRGGPPAGLFGGRPFVPAGARCAPPPTAGPVVGWMMHGAHPDPGCSRGPPPPAFPGPHGCPPVMPPPPMGPIVDSESSQKGRDFSAWGATFYSKLDSRFVCDVSIFDGTELAPGTPFTKIWRMRNTGNTNWPQGTALTHIGGDRLADVSAVTLPLSPEGVGVDEECDVAVDAMAPMLPGRYVSHWRLVAPNGPKFGHRVWMLIQVVPRGEISPQEAMLLKKGAEDEASDDPVPQGNTEGSDKSKVQLSAPLLELLDAAMDAAAESTSSSMLVPPPPTPPLEKGVSVEEVVKHAPTDVTGILSEAALYLSQVAAREQEPTLKTETSAVSVVPTKTTSETGSSSDKQELKDTMMSTEKGSDGLAEKEEVVSSLEDAQVQSNASGSDSPTGTEDSSFEGFALVNAPKPAEAIVYPEVVPHVPSTFGKEVASKAIEETVEVSSEKSDGLQKIPSEHVLAVNQLKAMGFHDTVLNVELLEKNRGDIQATVDDLVAAEEWDPMLEELEEMGFSDMETNRRLMFKNKGSVKQVVKELVEMYTSGTATLPPK